MAQTFAYSAPYKLCTFAVRELVPYRCCLRRHHKESNVSAYNNDDDKGRRTESGSSDVKRRKWMLQKVKQELLALPDDNKSNQGCQIGSFGAKNQKFGSFEKQLGPKCLFGYLATFWLFCNISFHKFFLEKRCEWCV